MNITMNEAMRDRVVLVVLGLLLLYLGWGGVVIGGWGLALKIIGFIPLITGIIGWCPLYSLFKFSTK